MQVLYVYMYMYIDILICTYVYDYTHTLSSMVSNLVRSIPSMRRGSLASEWSASARLNLTSWSTASFPTRASPTNRTRSGVLTRISYVREEGEGRVGRSRAGLRGGFNRLLPMTST